MNLFLRLFKHLLPRAKAWQITIDKVLRRFFDGLSKEPGSIRDFFDQRFLDVFPGTTSAVSEWLDQFNLLPSVDEATDRQNIAGSWRLNEYQSPTDIQNTLQAAGFDVYVHEWWEQPVPPSGPEPKNPFNYVGPAYLIAVCGNPAMCCGNEIAVCGAEFLPQGEIIVNKTDTQPTPIIPSDPDRWPYFLYIGGETFPDLATVPETRKNEFETLCLKICPAQQWLALLIDYT